MPPVPPNSHGSGANSNRPRGRSMPSVPMPPNAAGDRAHGGTHNDKSGPAVNRPAQMTPGTGGGASGRGNNHDLAQPAQGTQGADHAGMIPGSMREAK